jgi:hypothetical protein
MVLTILSMALFLLLAGDILYFITGWMWKG